MKQCREKKQQSLIKDIQTKLYFSRTQQGYFKQYGKEGEYQQELAKAIPKINAKKFSKIVEQVKQDNYVFSKYFEKERITKLTIDDIHRFQIRNEGQKKKISIPSNFRSSQHHHKQLNNNLVRIGFMMVLQKINQQISNSFVNQTKYLKQLIERQNQNLSELGYDYIGTSIQKSKKSFIGELKEEELTNGQFKFIGKGSRQRTQTVQNVEAYLREICEKGLRNWCDPLNN